MSWLEEPPPLGPPATQSSQSLPSRQLSPQTPPPPTGLPNNPHPPLKLWQGSVPYKKRLIPAWPDLLILAAGGASTIWWGHGPSFREFIGVAVAWVILHLIWLGKRGHRVWGPIVAVLTIVLADSGTQPHIPFRLARDCMTRQAEKALANGYDPAQRRIPFSGPGSCGMIDYESIQLFDADNRTEGIQSVVVFADSGPPSLYLFGRTAGYAYSPSHDLATCARVDSVGYDSGTCVTNPLGDGWYYVIRTTYLN